MSRILFYWARLYTSHIKKGEDYKTLQKTISILILDDVSHPSADYHACSHLHDCIQHITLNDMIEVHVLELPKQHSMIQLDKSNYTPAMDVIFECTKKGGINHGI